MVDVMLVAYLRFPTLCMKQKQVLPVTTVLALTDTQFGPCLKRIDWLEYRVPSQMNIALKGKGDV